MAPINLLYHAFKATTPFVDAFVNERLRQLLPSTNDCLLASPQIYKYKTAEAAILKNRKIDIFQKWFDRTLPNLVR